MLSRSLYWRSHHCSSKGGAIFPKVAFLATVVAPAIVLYARAGAPQMRASAYVTLYSTLLGRKTPRPLGLMVGSIIRSPPLLMSRLRPRCSTVPPLLLHASSSPSLWPSPPEQQSP